MDQAHVEEDEEGKEMSFLDHLELLRRHLIRAILAIMGISILVFANKDILFHEIIFGPARPKDFWTFRQLCAIGESIGSAGLFCLEELPFIIQSRKPTGQFTMHIAASVVAGFIVAFPYVFWEIWRFVAPGLYSKERRQTRFAVFFVSLLFLSGTLFGYFIIMPISLNFLSNYSVDPTMVQNEFDIISYVSLLIMVVLACGLMFQLPMVAQVLSRIGVVTPKLMKQYQRHAIVVILVLSALLTPPDVVSQVLIAVPIWLLYIISIRISARVWKKKRRLEEQELMQLEQQGGTA